MGDNYAIVFVTGDKVFLVYCGKQTGWTDISVELTKAQISSYQKFISSQAEEKKRFLKSMLDDIKVN